MEIDDLPVSQTIKAQLSARAVGDRAWAITSGQAVGALALTGDELYVFLPDTSMHWRFDELDSIEVERYAVHVRPHGHDGDLRFALKQPDNALLVHEHLSVAGAPLVGSRPAPSGTTVPGREPRARRPENPVEVARSQLNGLFLAGVVVQLLAGLLIALAWPHTNSDGVTDNGSTALVVLGWAVAWAGTILIAVAVIGWGVMLGNRASAATSSR